MNDKYIPKKQENEADFSLIEQFLTKNQIYLKLFAGSKIELDCVRENFRRILSDSNPFFNAELAIFSSGFAKKADTFLSFVDQFNQSNVLTYLKLLEVELGETEEAIMNSQEEIVNYLYKCAEEIGITFNILRTNYLHYFSYETLSHHF